MKFFLKTIYENYFEVVCRGLNKALDRITVAQYRCIAVVDQSHCLEVTVVRRGLTGTGQERPLPSSQSVTSESQENHPTIRYHHRPGQIRLSTLRD